MSITPDGPPHLLAVKSSVVSLFLRARRTKLPVSARWLAEPAHDVPDGIPVQQLALPGIGMPVDGLGDPGLQPGQLLIA